MFPCFWCLVDVYSAESARGHVAGSLSAGDLICCSELELTILVGSGGTVMHQLESAEEVGARCNRKRKEGHIRHDDLE